MAKVVLAANLNADRVMTLDSALVQGGRSLYQDQGLRVGGGGANTGAGLVWAGYEVELVAQVGQDQLGAWLLEQAQALGLQTAFIKPQLSASNELLIMLTPDGERTILRPRKQPFQLPQMPNWQTVDLLYFNSHADNAAEWAQAALAHSIVLAQLDTIEDQLPCHFLIGSHHDLPDTDDLWQFALSKAGAQLQGFIVTHGAQGAYLYTAETTEFVAAYPTTVIDSTGAGDAYVGGFIHGLLQQQTLRQAMQEAARWGSFAVASESSIPAQSLYDYLQQAR